MNRGNRNTQLAHAIGETMAFGKSIMSFDMLHNIVTSCYFYIPYDREGTHLGLPPRTSIFQEVAEIQSQLLLNGELESEYAVMFTSRLGTHPHSLVECMDVRSIKVQGIRVCDRFPWQLDGLKKDYLNNEDGQGGIYQYDKGEITRVDWDHG